MFVICPQCNTMLRLQHELSARQDKVRCNRCQQVFDAAQNLVSNMSHAPAPDPDPDPEPAHPLAIDATRQYDNLDSAVIHAGASVIAAAPAPPPDDNAAENAAPTRAAAVRTATKPAAYRLDTHGVEQVIRRPNPLIDVFWLVAAMSFVVLLGFQIKLFFVDEYAQDMRYRPLLNIFCKIADCRLPPRQDLYRLTLVNTKIDFHPSEPDAIRITVQIMNQADFAQPYPNLQLTLTDRAGRIVGRRTFSSDFYLRADQANLLPATQLSTVWFDLANPHKKAVGFVVDIVTQSLLEQT